MIEIKLQCQVCKTIYVITVNREDVIKYNNGALVQDAFPYLSRDNRELIISKICGKCFDKLCDIEQDE